MKIEKVICSKGRTGFFFDDQKAIKAGAKNDGAAYIGQPVTPGFTSIRMAGESISVQLVLSDGQIAWGDCAAVQYSGAGGRDPLFLAEDFIPYIQEVVAPHLIGRELTSFKELAGEINDMKDPKTGKRIHTAIRYGVTQAILDAVAKSKHTIMAEVIAEEYNCTVSDKELPIFTQSGDNRYENADKMILKGAQVLPHALINHVETKLGQQRRKTAGVCEAGSMTASSPCAPMRAISRCCTSTCTAPWASPSTTICEKIADYMKTLCDAAAPFHLRIEGPVDVGDRDQANGGPA